MKKKVRSHDGSVADSRAWLRWMAFCSLVVASLWIGPVSAQDQPTPPTWAVRVRSEGRCADDARFAATLSDAIPVAQLAPVDSAELVAEVTVTASGQQQHASIRVYDRVLESEAGARELDLPLSSCAATADALSLVLGVLVEAGRAAPAPVPAQQTPEPPPEPATPPPTAPPPSPTEEEVLPARKEEQRQAPPQRYAWLGPRAGHDLTLLGGGGWGLLPGVYAGGTAGWGIRLANMWPIWLTATGFLPRESKDGRGRFAAVYGGVAVCPLTFASGRLRAQVCPGLSAGALWAKAKGLLVARDQKHPIALAGLDFIGDFRVAGPLALSLRVRAEVPLSRERFVYYRADGATPELHQAAPVALSLFGGLSLLFR
jgi:hypothetical protein